MHFEYEITVDDYAAAQNLYYRLSIGKKHVKRIIGWIVAGAGIIVIAWNERSLNWAPILLVAIGSWWVYSGISNLFPNRYFRRAYRGLDLAAKKFEADVNEEGYNVTGESGGFHTSWRGVRLKGEDRQVFIFYAEGTIFMVGKKYLNVEQQQQIRILSRLPVPSA